MKKQLSYWFGLMFVLLLLLVACSGYNPNPQLEDAEPTETEVIAQSTATVDEAAQEEAAPIRSPLKVAEDFSLPDGQGNLVSLDEHLQANEQVVLVFYYGAQCRPCMAQLSEIANDHTQYKEKGVQVIAVAVQGERAAERTADFIDAQFPVLADRERTVADAFGVLEEGGLSTPSVFIIDKDKQIVWSEISHIEGSGCGSERVPSQTILENLG